MTPQKLDNTLSMAARFAMVLGNVSHLAILAGVPATATATVSMLANQGASLMLIGARGARRLGVLVQKMEQMVLENRLPSPVETAELMNSIEKEELMFLGWTPGATRSDVEKAAADAAAKIPGSN